MREIFVSAPRVSGDRVEFAWRVEPATPLYHRTSFTLRFPESIDLAAIPDRVWWTVALLCLHGQWPLLRPCRIHLPVRLGAGESEFWCRLVDAAVATLEAHSGVTASSRAIEIVEDGEPVADIAPLPDRGRCAAAFSGGKDSLLQTGVLTELFPDVLLVTTTSPMPPLHDHQTPRRRQVLRDVAARRPGVTLVEVQSDLRSAWKNDFPPSAGYQVAVNELSDTFLYLSSLLVAAWSHGATHLFLASEAEVQENAEIGGRVVQHPHAMYSAVTQSALSALLARVGMRYGSLISPLRSAQVQQLLWKRYGDLADLQYSCWRVGEDDATCSSCSQCLRIAFAALAAGESPQRMGIDLVKLIETMHGWKPRIAAVPPLLPNERVARELHLATVRSIAATPIRRYAAAIPPTPRGLRAIFLFRQLQKRAKRVAASPPPGYRPGYLELVDPLVRDELARIYASSFASEEQGASAEMLERAHALIRWISEPLAASSAAGILQPVKLEPSELARLEDIIPGGEPALELPRERERILPVAETLLDGNELRYVSECIASNWVSSEGPFVRRFEEAFAAAMECRYGVACSSGTAALHLVLAAFGLGPGDEVILPSFTMIATANAVSYVGATPVLVDSDPVTWNMDVDAIARAITSRTRAIIVVHTYGHPAEMDPILDLAAKHGLRVIEDAAEAHGAMYRYQSVGSLGDAATFSFYGNKIVTTGEGGMITTNDARIADLTRQLRGHAFSRERHFWHEYLGYNYRMTNLQAAVGLAQTERLPFLVEVRRRNAALYRKRLSGIAGLTLPVEQPDVRNVFWMYALLVEDDFGCTRDELRQTLARRGIETRTMFVPIHLQPLYHPRFRDRSFPVAEELCRKGLYLPSGPGLTASDIDYVAGEIARAAKAAVGAELAWQPTS